MNTENIDLLQKIALFKNSTREELEIVIGLFQERQMKPGAVIFTEQMPAETLSIVKSGSVRITMMAGEGEEVSLLLLGPGDFFGELALLHEENRLVAAKAESAVDLLVLTRKDFQALLDLDPRSAAKISLAITKLLAMRIKQYTAQLKDLLLT